MAKALAIFFGSLMAISMLCALGIRFLDWYQKRRPNTTRQFIPPGWFEKQGGGVA